MDSSLAPVAHQFRDTTRPYMRALDGVTRDARSATDELMRRLGTISAASPAPSPQWLRTLDGTLLGALSFAAMHEAYHVGQMGFLRKWLGLDPIFDG